MGFKSLTGTTCVFLIATSFNANAAIMTFNSTSSSASNIGTARDNWIAASGITTPQYLVDFETGFVDDQNISGIPGLFPGGLVISDTSSAGAALIEGTTGGIGGSNPVGDFALEQNEQAYLELDFSSNPVDYLGFQDIDHTSTTIIVTFVGGSTDTFSIETTGTGGNSAEFTAIFRNDMPKITLVQMDSNGDGSWGIDNIEYGSTMVPVPAAAWLFGSGLMALIGIARRKTA